MIEKFELKCGLDHFSAPFYINFGGVCDKPQLTYTLHAELCQHCSLCQDIERNLWKPFLFHSEPSYIILA